MASGFFRRISSVLPPPHYLAMPAFGVDLSYHSVRAVLLEHARAPQTAHTSSGFIDGSGGAKVTANDQDSDFTLCLKRWSEHHVAKGGVVYEDDISKQPELKETLINLRKDFNVKYAVASLPDDKAFIFKTQVPLGNDTQIRNAIAFQLEDNVSMPANEAVFDYDLLRGSGGTLEAVVVVFPRKTVENTATLFKSAGIMPISFVMTADALAAAVVPTGDNRVHLLINIGQHHTGICVVDRGVVCFTTTLSFGENSLISAVSKQFNVSESVAAQAINGDIAGLPGHQTPFTILQSVASTVSALRDEAWRIIDYWRTHEAVGQPDREVARIMLCGNGANTPGMDEYLSVDMKIPTSVGNPWQNAGDMSRCLPALKFSESLGYSCAIGLAVKVVKREI